MTSWHSQIELLLKSMLRFIRAPENPALSIERHTVLSPEWRYRYQ